jgi:hypothetical protein
MVAVRPAERTAASFSKIRRVQRIATMAHLVARKRQEKGKRSAFELPQVAATTPD